MVTDIMRQFYSFFQVNLKKSRDTNLILILPQNGKHQHKFLWLMFEIPKFSLRIFLFFKNILYVSFGTIWQDEESKIQNLLR